MNDRVNDTGVPLGRDAHEIEAIQTLGDRMWWCGLLLVAWLELMLTMLWFAPLLPFVLLMCMNIMTGRRWAEYEDDDENEDEEEEEYD